MKKIVILIITLTFICTGLISFGESQYRTVTDHNGNIVNFPKNPQRVIALNQTIMDGLYEIGIKPIAKIDDYKIRKEGIALPSVGTRANVNIEAIYKLKPDVIIANSRGQGAIYNQLIKTGAAVYMFNPSKLGNQPFYEVPIFLGKLFNKENIAKNRVSFLKNLANKYKNQILQETSFETGLIIKSLEDISVYQNPTGYGTLLTTLGIKNVVPDNMPGSSKDAAVRLSIEKIYEQNPDIILIMAPSKNEKENQKIIKRLKKDSKWKYLKAVKKNNIKIMPFKLHPGRSTREVLIKMMAETILSMK